MLCHCLSAENYLNDTRLLEKVGELTTNNIGNALTALLAYWTRISDKPTVFFLDEIDTLAGEALISVLRQIRAGYMQRPCGFPQSIILCGVRDVRDYQIHTKHKEIITGGSAFNIKAESLQLGNFTQIEIFDLWQQHTEETQQVIDSDIFPELWLDTRGQPWLVNALGYELTWRNRRLQDRSIPITLEDYKQARYNLIKSRATHLHQLTDKLKEKRVHRVISALLSGNVNSETIPADDMEYVTDLGLIQSIPQVRISNRIYQEVIPRELIWTKQVMIAHQQSWYLTPEHRLDMPKLLAAFQQFFRQNANSWIEKFDYKEAGPQLLLQAFLQRIINSGGRVHREYGLANYFTDIFVEWPVSETDGYHGEVQRIVLELKILYNSIEKTIQDGLQQTAKYADECNADESHLLIFDRRPHVLWDDKIWQCLNRYQHNGYVINIWGM